MASEEYTVDLRVVGQPQCCKALRLGGWVFRWDRDTRFVSAEHPRGGKQSVVSVCNIGRSGFDVDEIGRQITMLLNGNV